MNGFHLLTHCGTVLYASLLTHLTRAPHLQGLVVLVLGLELAMACVLLASVAKHGKMYNTPEVEMEPLQPACSSGSKRKGARRGAQGRRV